MLGQATKGPLQQSSPEYREFPLLILAVQVAIEERRRPHSHAQRAEVPALIVHGGRRPLSPTSPPTLMPVMGAAANPQRPGLLVPILAQQQLRPLP